MGVDGEGGESPHSTFMGVTVGHRSEHHGLEYFSCSTLEFSRVLKLSYDKMDFQKEQMGCRPHYSLLLRGLS